MEFQFETDYSRKALTAMAKAVRKTVRKKRSRRTHIFGWIVLVIGLLLALPLGEDDAIQAGDILGFFISGLLLVVLIFEDRLNGLIAGTRMLPGMKHNSAVFGEENYTTSNEMGKTEWHYDKIDALAESRDYFVFVFGNNHAQVYGKSGISGGTADEFRSFITEKTGRTVLKI
ncbi:MAG: YcxB family protein [Clostridia bacterium]|nr:YcxB family protein [Clostridia bacterium]MBQ8369272.1 YcxB family protein [Clostridia bacterium]MBQ8513440.1 YcxB family protein [Clostridia bacterium]